MTHHEIRRKFLEFFEKRGHKIVPSSSLIPDDPSVLFTTAGMQQFKKYYLEAESPYGNRVASIQKCLRTSDIDQVGDESHLTFFEMLGNFSFKFPEAEDAYFKEEAIKSGYDFIVRELGVPLERLKISVFRGDGENKLPADNESLAIWKALGIPDEKIFFGDKNDNFWGPTGLEGPCGPTTEIHIDDIEIWNLVFNEYYCDKEKHLVTLERKGVDTGMGLERLAMILEGQRSVFETDLFVLVITELHGQNLYHGEKNIKSERIIADHLKAGIFMISDGIMPSNIGRGHILRRLIRRIIRHAKLLNLPEDFYQRSIETIIKVYEDHYPELDKNKDLILKIINEEDQKFTKALEKGTKEFERGIVEFKNKGQRMIPGPYVFGLQQSLGMTFDIMQDMAQEKGMAIDLKGFKEEEEKHKEISRAGVDKKFGLK